MPLIFSVEPDRFVMEPKTSCTFTVKGLCTAPRVVEEKVICTAALGNAPKPIFESRVIGTFIHPLVKVSEQSLTFNYVHDPNVTPPPQVTTSKINSIANPIPFDISFPFVSVLC